MPEQDWQTMHDSLLALQDALFRAAIQASDRQLRDRLRAGSDAAADAVEAMDREDFESRTARFQAVSQKVKEAATGLDSLREEIDGIANKTELLLSASNAIAQVLSQATKF